MFKIEKNPLLTETVMFKVPKKEKTELKKLAKHYNMSMSTFIRKLASLAVEQKNAQENN